MHVCICVCTGNKETGGKANRAFQLRCVAVLQLGHSRKSDRQGRCSIPEDVDSLHTPAWRCPCTGFECMSRVVSEVGMPRKPTPAPGTDTQQYRKLLQDMGQEAKNARKEVKKMLIGTKTEHGIYQVRWPFGSIVQV